MPDFFPDAIPGLEGYLAVLLSCIVLRRRRAAAHRAQVAPSIVKSRPWERGFTVEGRAPNRHRAARDVLLRVVPSFGKKTKKFSSYLFTKHSGGSLPTPSGLKPSQQNSRSQPKTRTILVGVVLVGSLVVVARL